MPEWDWYKTKLEDSTRLVKFLNRNNPRKRETNNWLVPCMQRAAAQHSCVNAVLHSKPVLQVQLGWQGLLKPYITLNSTVGVDVLLEAHPVIASCRAAMITLSGSTELLCFIIYMSIHFFFRFADLLRYPSADHSCPLVCSPSLFSRVSVISRLVAIWRVTGRNQSCHLMSES